MAVDAGGAEGARQARQVQVGDGAVREHDDARLFQHGLQMPPGIRQQAAPDQDVVAARAQLDPQAVRLDHCAARSASASAVALRRICAASAPITRSSVTSGGPSTLSTVMSASA